VPFCFCTWIWLKVASGFLRRFLLEFVDTHVSQHSATNASLQAAHKLSVFSSQYRAWLICVCFLFVLTFILDINTSFNALFAHIATVASYRAFVKMSYEMISFCFPASIPGQMHC